MRLRNLRKVAANLVGALVVAASCGSCADIRLLESGICGNFVIDPGEDCDGHPLEKGTECAAPEEPKACRQTCSDVLGCPGGWGCGKDGICRHSSGLFAPLGEKLPFAPPVVMYPGDFDGDKTSDLLVLGHENALGTRSARLAYAQPGSVSIDLRTLAERLTSPSITDVDADGSPLDIAFATVDGISLLRGTRDRATDYSVFPFFNVPQSAAIRLVPTNVFPDVPGDEILAFLDHPNASTTLSAFNGQSIETLITLAQGVETIAGKIGRARFAQNAPCEQLVFAYRDAHEVLVYSPCRTDGSSGWNIAGTPTAITLPGGVSIQDGVLVADLDFDNHIDILVGTHGKPHVAWGNGDGTFISDKSNGVMNVAGPYTLPAEIDANPEFPLAVADLNADQKIDYVLPQGVLVSRNGGYGFVFKTMGDPWATAVIADLNANGLDDVIAGSSEAIDLNFLNNAGGGVFNPSTVPTESPVSLLEVADYDGDLIRDVAVVQSYHHLYDPSQGMDDVLSATLSIGFGKSHGAPASLVTVGRLDNTTQIVSAALADSENEGAGVDGIADLIAVDEHLVTVDDVTALVRHAVLFRGNGSRVMHTSRPLTDGGQVSLPLAVAVAHFADEAPEIAALGADIDTGELKFWTIEGAEADLARPGPTIPPGFHPLGNMPEISFHYGAYMATGDLDHDGTDEIVLIAPFGNEADGAAVVIADFQEDDTYLPRTHEPISAALTVDNKFELHDVDGDGHLDGVLSTGSEKKPNDLIVLWGDGNGQLLTKAPVHVRPVGGVSAFACVPAKVGCRLILTSSSGTYSTSVSSGRDIDFTRIEDLPAGSAIASGDFDGDGVIDIAVHAQDGISFYRSLPVRP